MVKTKHRIVGVFLSVCVLLLCMAGMPIKASAADGPVEGNIYTYSQIMEMYAPDIYYYFFEKNTSSANENKCLGWFINGTYGKNPGYQGSEENSKSSIENSNWKYTGFIHDVNARVVVAFVRASSSTPTPATKYTVTWKNWDGTVLETDTNVAKGTTPQYNGKTPTRPSKDGKTYTFKGWTPEITSVTENVTYTAVFKESETETKPDPETKPETDPETEPETKPVTEPTPEKNTFTVTWKNWDGTVLETDENVAKGAEPEYNGKTPTRTAEGRIYSFRGWSPELSKVTEDVTYTAVMSYSTRECTVSFDTKGGNYIASQTVKYGDTASKPSDPVKKNASFDKWYADAALTTPYNFTETVTENITVYAGWINDTAIAKPTVSGKYTYTGSEQKVVLAGFDSGKMTVSGTTSAAAVGTYTVSVSLNNGFVWSDGTTADTVLNWTIEAVPDNSFSITTPSGVSVSKTSAHSGDEITVTTGGQTVSVIANGKEIARISGYAGTFRMPAANVTFSVTGWGSAFPSVQPNSYVYVYSTDMELVMMRASNKGTITLKLGSEYADKSLTLYAEKKSTKTKLAEAETDENGDITLEIGYGKNYTLIIE
ncbi:MAG: InlB B-repeat-containing protein [Oscillospiraceae bacterium]|nr:InlB B-repeat-containing protein [Oscillospiraceae bacterium]